MVAMKLLGPFETHVKVMQSKCEVEFCVVMRIQWYFENVMGAHRGPRSQLNVIYHHFNHVGLTIVH